MTDISLIVAADQNNIIGGDNKLLWHIPEDLKRFKALTLGKPIIMGRKTYDSIGRPLPSRPNIVITRNPQWKADGLTVVTSLEDAFKAAESLGPETMVIGGATIYEAALPFATSVYLTRIHKAYDGDAVFPALSPSEWQEVSRTKGEQCEAAGIDYEFIKYQRIA